MQINRNQWNNFDRRRPGWLIIDQGWMGTINWWVQGIFEIRERFYNQLSKDSLSVGARKIRNKRKIYNQLSKDWLRVGASKILNKTKICRRPFYWKKKKGVYWQQIGVHLAATNAKNQLRKPWVKNQGIQPHTDHMPPCGCIARFYRWHLADGEFLHHNGRIWIDDIGVLVMRSVPEGEVSVVVLDFLVLPFLFAIWKSRLDFGQVRWKFY